MIEEMAFFLSASSLSPSLPAFYMPAAEVSAFAICHEL